MIDPTAECDRPFLKATPARERLSRIQNVDVESFDGCAKSVCQGGNARQMLEEVQRNPFSLQDGSSVPGYMQDRLAILGPFTIMSDDRDAECGIN